MIKAFYTGLILLIIILASCQKEIDFVTGNNNNNGGNNSNCKACAYLPYCDGASYSYYDTLLGSTATVISDNLQFLKDTVFSGKTFHKFSTTSSTTAVYTNCTSGVTTVAVLDAAVTGGTIPKIELRPLQENLPVNGSWSDTIMNGFGQAVIYTHTIKGKGISKSLSGKTFNDVIYVQTDTGIDFPGLGYILTNKSDYYYARGVGLIEALITNEDGTLVYQHQVIKDYNIP